MLLLSATLLLLIPANGSKYKLFVHLSLFTCPVCQCLLSHDPVSCEVFAVPVAVLYLLV